MYHLHGRSAEDQIDAGEQDRDRDDLQDDQDIYLALAVEVRTSVPFVAAITILL